MLDFIEALGTWVEESVSKWLQKASVFSGIANECPDITAVEVMSVFSHWEEEGTRLEFFLDIVPLNKAVPKSIYLAHVKCIKGKSLQVSNFVGIGFDDAATSSIKKTGVQARLKKCPTCSICPLSLSPPAISLRASCQ